MMGKVKDVAIRIGSIKKEIKVPQSWSDLDLQKLALYYNTLFTNPGSEFTLTGFTMVKLISMTQHLLGVNSVVMAKWEADCLKEDPQNGDVAFLSELRMLLHSTLFGLFEIEEDEATMTTTYAAKLNLTKNPYPALSHTPKPKSKNHKPKTSWFYSPADLLKNVTLYELAYSFTLFENYLKTDDESLAHQLIAAIYRPSRAQTQADKDSGWFGDRRQPLRKYEAKISERANLVKTLPALSRRLIIFWFASCRQHIIEKYPRVFRQVDEETSSISYGWGGLLLAMAGGPVGLESISDQHHSNGLTWLSMKEDERREQEAAFARAKKQ